MNLLSSFTETQLGNLGRAAVEILETLAEGIDNIAGIEKLGQLERIADAAERIEEHFGHLAAAVDYLDDRVVAILAGMSLPPRSGGSPERTSPAVDAGQRAPAPVGEVQPQTPADIQLACDCGR